MSVPADLLDDLAVRFVLNMPDEEKNDPIRICFQMEVAFWFYIDFYCETMPNLPRLKLRKFAYIMFEHIPRLHKFLDPEVFDKVCVFAELAFSRALPDHQFYFSIFLILWHPPSGDHQLDRVQVQHSLLRRSAA